MYRKSCFVHVYYADSSESAERSSDCLQSHTLTAKPVSYHGSRGGHVIQDIMLLVWALVSLKDTVWVKTCTLPMYTGRSSVDRALEIIHLTMTQSVPSNSIHTLRNDPAYTISNCLLYIEKWPSLYQVTPFCTLRNHPVCTK